jgi:hypothetical protein
MITFYLGSIPNADDCSQYIICEDGITAGIGNCPPQFIFLENECELGNVESCTARCQGISDGKYFCSSHEFP